MRVKKKVLAFFQMFSPVYFAPQPFSLLQVFDSAQLQMRNAFQFEEIAIQRLAVSLRAKRGLRDNISGIDVEPPGYPNVGNTIQQMIFRLGRKCNLLPILSL